MNNTQDNIKTKLIYYLHKSNVYILIKILNLLFIFMVQRVTVESGWKFFSP